MGEARMHTILVEERDMKRPLLTPWRRRWDNIKMYFKQDVSVWTLQFAVTGSRKHGSESSGSI
jgi:hypothetical protein